MNTEIEIWKKIEGFDNYEVSNKARTRNSKTGRILKPHYNADGYIYVSMSQNGKLFNRSLHVIMANLFVPNPQGKETVNHKDGRKDNCMPDNLEWADRSYQMKHAYELGLIDTIKKYKQPVAQCDPVTGDIIQIFESVMEASRRTKVGRVNITKVCTVEAYKTAGGFKWQYVEMEG